jgi:hypothetical protein
VAVIVTGVQTCALPISRCHDAGRDGLGHDGDHLARGPCSPVELGALGLARETVRLVVVGAAGVRRARAVLFAA